jgi:geranylgeranyl pyrophosphate synthase
MMELAKKSKKALALAQSILTKEKMESWQARDAFEHYFEHWNDFIHPGMFSMAYEAAGGNLDNLVSPQAAIAMMAAAFDLHDDIIDQSKTKYGAPTIYGRFGAETALLLGNAFLIEGFKLLIDSMSELPRDKASELLQEYKKLLFEVGNAHSLEVMLKNEGFTANDCMKIIEMKAAGIEADMYVGAVLGEGNRCDVRVLSRIGRILGILATLRDEFVDVFEIDELRQRMSTGYLPVPIMFTLEDSEARTEAISVVSKRNLTEKDVDRLLDIVLQAKSVVQLKKQMHNLKTEGIQLALKLHHSTLQKQFCMLFEFMLEDL